MTTLQPSLVSGICTVMLMAQLITGTLAGTHKEIRKTPQISVTPKVNPPVPLTKKKKDSAVCFITVKWGNIKANHVRLIKIYLRFTTV